MRKSFALAIPAPCHQNWKEFAPTEKGGFCDSCKKEVVDFTSWSEDDIKNYFKHQRGSTCGKFQPHQLKLYREAPPRKGWIPSLIAFALLVVSRPAEAQTTVRHRTEDVQKIDQRVVVGDTTAIPIVIWGIVLDANDRTALPGVNVVEQDTDNICVTDAEGKFQLQVRNEGDSIRLTFAFVGYEPKAMTLPRATSHETEVKMFLDVSVLGGITVGGVVALPWYSLRRWWWKVKSIFR